MRRAPDGRYLVVARVVDPASGQTAREKRRVVIDTVPPSLTGLRVSPEPWTGTGSVHLAFRLTDAGPGASFGIRVAVQDVAGRRVRHVTHLVRKRGIQSVTWNPRKPSGGFPPTAATRSFFGRPTKPAIGGRAVQRRSGLLGEIFGLGRELGRRCRAAGRSHIRRLREPRRVVADPDHIARGEGPRHVLLRGGSYVKVWPGLSRQTASLGMTIGWKKHPTTRRPPHGLQGHDRPPDPGGRRRLVDEDPRDAAPVPAPSWRLLRRAGVGHSRPSRLSLDGALERRPPGLVGHIGVRDQPSSAGEHEARRHRGAPRTIGYGRGVAVDPPRIDRPAPLPGNRQNTASVWEAEAGMVACVVTRCGMKKGQPPLPLPVIVPLASAPGRFRRPAFQARSRTTWPFHRCHRGCRCRS